MDTTKKTSPKSVFKREPFYNTIKEEYTEKINNFSDESDTINLFNKMKYLVNTLVDIETNLIKESKDELQRQQYEVRLSHQQVLMQQTKRIN